MPIINHSEVGQSFTPGFRAEPEEVKHEPEARDVFRAAFERENTIGSALQTVRGTAFDSTFNPFDSLEGYEDKATSFAYANTPEEVAGIKAKIDKERDNERLLQDAGTLGFVAGMTAGIFDPINLIPIGGAAYKSYTMGGSILKGAANTARAGLISATAAEAALHATQETRTLGESAVNVAGATLLSGVLGGAVGYVGGRNLGKLGKQIEDDLVVPRPDEADIGEPNSVILGGSVGAAAVRSTTLAEEALSKAWGLEKGMARLNPKLRLSTSPSVEARRYAQDIMETPFFYEKNDAGIANPIAIETIVAMQDARAAKVIDIQNSTFTKYKKRAKADGADSLPYLEFKQEISKALRRSDTHAIPEVQEMAKAYRREIFDPMKEAAIKVGLLPEDVKTTTADSYLYRWWDKQIVAARRNELRPIILDSLRADLGKTIKKFDVGTDIKARNIQSEIDELSMAGLRDDTGFVEGGKDITEAEILDAIRQLKSPPKKPETLISFLHKSGGLVDSGGELKHIGLTNKARPGFVRKSGMNFDDAALKAWEDGFFPHLQERPDIEDLLGAIRDDYTGNLVVRESDRGYAQELERLADIQRGLDELGVDIDKFKGVRRIDSNVDIEKLKSSVNKIQAERRLQRIEDLKGRSVELSASRAEIRATQLDLSEDELSMIVDNIIDNILGGADTRIPYDLPLAARGPLKERVLNFVRDDAVESFLVNDAEAVARQFLRTMAPDIAIKERFGDLNIIGKDGIITQKINDGYNALIDNAKTDKERVRLEKLKKSDMRDIEAVVNQIRGTYGIPENPDSVIVRSGRAIRNLNYISKLGGVTLSSIPDVGRAVMVHGMMRTLGDGIVPLVTKFKAFKLSAREVKEAGTALDMTLNTRALTIAELNDPYVRGNRFEKGLQNLSNTFGKFTLMAPWNTALKQFSGVITQGRIIDSVAKSVKGAIKPKDARYLNMVGIDVNMAGRIAKQLEAHGDDMDGVKIANTNRWTDNEATLAYRAAIKKEVDRIIVTPGAGDLPLILKGTEAGKMIGQFRSFSFAATNKILISGLQERDAAFLNGVVLSVGLGMMAYAVKTLDSGRELSDDPAVWIQEGFDRSGLLGILSEGNQIANKLSRGTVSLQALSGQPPLTRYASVNVMGTLLGPSVGTVQDITQITGSAATGEWTKSDSRALRRMIPYQNLMIVRQLFDEMEEGINDGLGVE